MTQIPEDTSMHLSFDFNALFKSLKTYIDQYNHDHPQLTEKLNAGHRATAELMLRLYIKQLNHVGYLLPLRLNELPGFRTYVASLAGCKGCTVRTIFNHKERLKKANLIVAETHHGGEGLELWINPEIMCKGVYKNEILPEGGIRKTRLQPLEREDRKNIHPLAHVLQEQYNNNSNVENNGVLTDKCGLPNGEADTGASYKSTRKNVMVGGTLPENAKNTTIQVRKQKKEVQPISPVPGKMSPPPQREGEQEQQAWAGRIFLLSLVQEFWHCAKKTLYPDHNFKDWEDKDTLNLIYKSVYKGFRQQSSQQEWVNYHDSAIERLGMVRRWLDRSPNHWIPAPELYFSPHNEKNGFDKTWNWYVKQQALKLQIKNQLVFQQMRNELDQHSQNKGKHRNKSRYELFMKHKKQLDRMNDQGIKQAYYAAMQRYTMLQTNTTHA